MTIPLSTITQQTFQILDPISVAPPGSNPLSFIESGFTNLPMSQQVTNIVFTVPKASTYDIVEHEIVNSTDTTPINFSYEITAQSLTGFSVTLSGLPDTSSYYFQWTVQVPPVAPPVGVVIVDDTDGGQY